MNIRKANLDDVFSISKLISKAWKDSYKGMIEQEYLDSLNPEDIVQNIKRKLQENNIEYNVFVCEENDIIKGVATCIIEDKNAEIKALYVDENCKSQGIGKALINEAKSHFKGLGFEDIVIYTLTKNIAARSFYEKVGGKLSGTREKLIGTQRVPEVKFIIKTSL